MDKIKQTPCFIYYHGCENCRHVSGCNDRYKTYSKLWEILKEKDKRRVFND